MLQHMFCRSDFSTFKTIRESKTSFTTAVNPLHIHRSQHKKKRKKERKTELYEESARYPKSISVIFVQART